MDVDSLQNPVSGVRCRVQSPFETSAVVEGVYPAGGGRRVPAGVEDGQQLKLSVRVGRLVPQGGEIGKWRCFVDSFCRSCD